MGIFLFLLQFIGSLGFILYGMKMMSGGIQKSCGTLLQKAISSISKNKFRSLFTGMGVSILVQSSGSTASMGVSFVDAGILSLEQAVPLIFGANIGTTFTLWVIAFFGYSFDILVFALPVFAVGFLLTSIKKLDKESWGEALIGFGLLFIGVNWLNGVISSDEGVISVFKSICSFGTLSIAIGILSGLVFTALVNSSSLAVTVAIALAYFSTSETWPFLVAFVIGTEIGSTVNVFFFARKSKLDGKRIAFINVLFNFMIAVLALIFFKPLISLIDILTFGSFEKHIVFHVAMLHSMLKILGTLIFFPIQNLLIKCASKFFSEKNVPVKKEYKIEIPNKGMKDNAAAFIVRGEREIENMAKIVFGMFDTIKLCLFSNRKFLEEEFLNLSDTENYVDQMKEQLSHYILATQSLSVNDVQASELSKMLQIVNDLEDMSDDCYTIALLIKRGIEKKLIFEDEDIALLIPYTNLATKFLEFTLENLNKKLSAEQVAWANEIEDKIDDSKNSLKRVARKRLENGSNVKSELLYIDIVRQIEKVGDRAFSISEALRA